MLVEMNLNINLKFKLPTTMITRSLTFVSGNAVIKEGGKERVRGGIIQELLFKINFHENNLKENRFKLRSIRNVLNYLQTYFERQR